MIYHNRGPVLVGARGIEKKLIIIIIKEFLQNEDRHYLTALTEMQVPPLLEANQWPWPEKKLQDISIVYI